MEKNPFEVSKENTTEKRIETAVGDALAGFESPDFIDKIYYKDLEGERRLIIKYNKKTEDISSNVRRDFHDKLSKIFAQNNLELSSGIDWGDDVETFTLSELTIDGATNWRRWLPYPEKFDEEIKLLLDEAAEKVGQQSNGDRFSRFYAFLDEAEQKGLLSKEEVRYISMNMNRVSHF
ncbi:MAG: hypothetical protein P1P90_04505 [Patescibacteria group bacterium]|nr:hypothetical protein [Patescibacteria group bacterium]